MNILLNFFFFFYTLGGDWELIQWIGNKQKRKYPQIILHAENCESCKIFSMQMFLKEGSVYPNA